jgi:hypothetical protein
MNVFNIIIATGFGLVIIAIYLIYSIFKKLLDLLEQLLGEK